MNSSSKETQLGAPVRAVPVASQAVSRDKAGAQLEPVALFKSRPQTLLAIPVAAVIGLAIHYFIPKSEPVLPTNF
jgi:hypothetical protein